MNRTGPKSKVLIFIVAYHAEKHIESVLERIPESVRRSERVHILCVDDASSDQSARTAAAWAEKNHHSNITILRNPVNQGYGGNQKIGYRFAIDNGFDLAILLHGDGQYAPELLPQFIELWERTKPDVILGSRMHSISSARRGGMPLYKVVGNRILTTFQNLVTGNSLSEYHTGYRAYSTNYLRTVPFEINTNDFHFDTEILLQAFHAKAQIAELPIPTHYGDEICRVDGLRYAKDVFFSTLQYRFSQLGMFCSLKYKSAEPAPYERKTSERYSASAKAITALKKFRPRTVLDLGCGSGLMSKQCAALGASVTAVDMKTPPGELGVDKFFLVDFEKDSLPVDALSYDTVLLLDVLEQLARPEEFLLQMRNATTADLVKGRAPHVVISTPNIAFITMRLGLLLGRFNYSERGILNITNKRLFTKSSLRSMLADCGYSIDEWHCVGAPFELVLPGLAGKLLASICDKLALIAPELFAFQFLVVCRPKPGVNQLLLRSQKYLLGTGMFKESAQEHDLLRTF